MAVMKKAPPKGKKALPPFMGKESKKEEKMEMKSGKMPAFKAGGKVKKGC